MRALMLAVASLAVTLPSPAAAQSASDARSSAGSGSFHGDFGDRDRRDHRRNRGHGGDIFLGDWEYTGRQVWQSDSFNDWWHDRPDRAYPRWVINNQNCERKWWGGNTLRC